MRKDKPKNNKKKSKKIKLKMLSPDVIQENPKGLRKVDENKHYFGLKDSISAKGVLQPLIVYQQKDGVLVLRDGARRLQASKDLGLKKIPVLIIKKSSHVKTLIFNMHREDILPLHKAKFVKKILDKKNISQRELAKKLGKDESWVSHLNKIASMDKTVIKKLDNSWTFTQLKKLAGMKHQDKQLRMIADIKRGGTRRQIMEAQNPIDVLPQFEKVFEQLERLLRIKIIQLPAESIEKLQVRYEKLRWYFPAKKKKSS